MKRFSFSRSRLRSTPSSERVKDLYDPDQRPITISCNRKKSNQMPIVRPRVNTASYIINSVKMEMSENSNSNYKHPSKTYINNNNNNEDISSQPSIDYIQPYDSKSCVLPSPLPFIETEDMFRPYSPPDVKSPKNSRITRFVNTSHNIDRLGKSYSSQTGRSTESCRESKIVTIDTYKEIAKKTFKGNSDETNNEREKREFLSQYLLDHTKHENAKIIQKTFRLSQNRKHFKRFIRINMTINNNLKKLTFNLWRLTTINDANQMKKIFKSVTDLYSFISAHFKIRKIAPFRLFYITSQIFIPKGYTAEQIFRFFYLMHFYSLSRTFKLWVQVTKRQIDHRVSMIFTRFPGKKFSNFGMIYHMFINWHRLTLWKKEARNNPKKKLIKLGKLNLHEANVFWNVKEHNLNVKRMRMKRATESSRKRIATKAVRALYNRLIESVSEKAIIENADLFRNMHLQAFTHRAWLKFMQKRSQEQQVLRDSMHAWYNIVYEKAFQKTTVKLGEILFLNNFKVKIMNAWFKQARERKIRRIATALRTHNKPSAMFLIIFALQNDFELAFHVFCFRMWIRITRARKRWFLFNKWCKSIEMNDDSDIADKERKIIVLNDLKRAAHLKLIRRGSSMAYNFIPRHTWRSLELTFVALHQIEFVQNHRTLDFDSLNETIFQSESKTWKFMTEKNSNLIENTNDSEEFSEKTLLRCFLLKLHEHKNYELAKIEDNFADNKINPQFVKLRSLKDLEDQSLLNTSILRKHNIEKVRRDHATLASFKSHISAQKTRAIFSDFSITNFNINNNNSFYDKCDNYDSIRSASSFSLGVIFVYPELEESIEQLKKENQQSMNRLYSTFAQTKQIAFLEFQHKFRNHFVTLMNSPSSFSFQEDAVLKTNKNTSSSSSVSSTIDNVSLSSFDLNMSQTSLNSPVKLMSSPIKNNMISSYSKPVNVNRSVDDLMSLLDDQSSRFLAPSNFNINNFKRILDKFQTNEDIIQSLSIFFQNVCQVYLDVSEVKSLANSDDLLPSPSINLSRNKNSSNKAKKNKNKSSSDEEKTDDDEASIIIQTHRHVMQKNMNIFIAELSGYTNLDNVPLKLSISTSVSNCISAIFTIFNALKKNKSLSQYLDLTPFSTKLKSTDDILVSTQDKVWNTLKASFPKLEMPNENSDLVPLAPKTKRKSAFNSSLFTIGSVQNIDDVMGSNDAFLACYLLPYILSFDSVIDFIKDEMKSNQDRH